MRMEVFHSLVPDDHIAGLVPLDHLTVLGLMYVISQLRKKLVRLLSRHALKMVDIGCVV
jgi:hypothetical protein